MVRLGRDRSLELLRRGVLPDWPYVRRFNPESALRHLENLGSHAPARSRIEHLLRRVGALHHPRSLDDALSEAIRTKRVFLFKHIPIGPPVSLESVVSLADLSPPLDGRDDVIEPTSGRLKVVLVRHDTNVPVAGIRTRLSPAGGVRLAEKSSLPGTGEVDFGEVHPGAYVVDVLLDDDERRAFAVPKTLAVEVAKNEKKTAEIRLAPLVRLRVVLWNNDDEPLAGRKWRLTEPALAGSTTGRDGLIDVGVPADVTQAKLVVSPHESDETTNEADVAAESAEYHPPIIAEEFAVGVSEDHNQASSILSIDVVSLASAQADHEIRLRNLGFGLGNGGDEGLRVAVQRYQARYLATPQGSGLYAEIASDLQSRYDQI